MTPFKCAHTEANQGLPRCGAQCESCKILWPPGRTWTCQRQAKGQRCGWKNLKSAKKCQACGKLRPAVRRAGHLKALQFSYEEYIALNGGEFCGICGALPDGRRLDRDHAHDETRRPRGLLCRKCNRALTKTRYGLTITPEWLRSAADYMERS